MVWQPDIGYYQQSSSGWVMVQHILNASFDSIRYPPSTVATAGPLLPFFAEKQSCDPNESRAGVFESVHPVRISNSAHFILHTYCNVHRMCSACPHFPEWPVCWGAVQQELATVLIMVMEGRPQMFVSNWRPLMYTWPVSCVRAAEIHVCHWQTLNAGIPM